MQDDMQITVEIVPIKLYRMNSWGDAQTSLKFAARVRHQRQVQALHYLSICYNGSGVAIQPHSYFSLRPVVPALVADSGVHQFWLGTRFYEFQVAETIVYFNVFVIEFLHVLIQFDSSLSDSDKSLWLLQNMSAAW